MEAMSAGVPVVSGDLPAIRELVEQDVTGTLVRPGDIQALADTLSRLTDDPTRRTRLARDGLRRVQSEFEQGLNISRLRRAFSERAVRSRGACAPLTVTYVVIAPCRDEARFCRRTLDSLLAQTCRPSLILLVDDGSTDETPKILAEYAEKYPSFRLFTRKDRGKRKLGGGVIDASTRAITGLRLSSTNMYASWIWTLICECLLRTADRINGSRSAAGDDFPETLFYLARHGGGSSLNCVETKIRSE